MLWTRSWFWCFQVFIQIVPLQLSFLNLINSYYYLWLHCILLQALIWSSKKRACGCVLGLFFFIFFLFWNNIISSNLVACFYMASALSCLSFSPFYPSDFFIFKLLQPNFILISYSWMLQGLTSLIIILPLSLVQTLILFQRSYGLYVQWAR